MTVDLPYARSRLVFFAVHFALILGVNCADTFDLIGSGATVLPPAVEGLAQKGKAFFSAAIGRQSRGWNPVRPEVRAYLNCAGIEAGYGFFAPNVPNSYKVLFELHYPDGRVEYDVLGGDAGETNIRISSLLDQVGETTSDPLREVMMKLLTYSIWEFHPEAKTVRAILGALKLPSLSEFKAGEKRSYEFLYAYDFSFAEPTSP